MHNIIEILDQRFKPKNMEFREIDIDKYEGGIPSGFELVIAEKGDVEDTALVLYGFDEVNDFLSEFKKPIYGFLKL